MAAVLLVARLLLIAVFGIAGLAKLGDRAGSRQMLIDFGVPASVARPLAVILPTAEIAVAIALIPLASAWAGALAGLILLLFFTVGIAVNLARGRTPNCRCFGQLHVKPVGVSTLARNVALAALAGLLLIGGRNAGGMSMFAWFGTLELRDRVILALTISGLGLFFATGLVVVQLLRQQGRLLLRIEALEARTGVPAEAPPAGLPLGVPAPNLTVRTLDDELIALETLWSAERPALLLFTKPNCEPCNALLPDIGRWQRELAGTMTIAVVAEGSAEDNRAKAAEHGILNVVLQAAGEVADAYHVGVTPSAVLVRSEGIMGSSLVSGPEQIRALVARVPIIGVPAPALRLPDLDGNLVDLLDLRGSNTLVVFWNPACGFCQKMLDDLKAWEMNPPPRAPKLLIVSTGDVAANRAQGFRSIVLLDDQDFATGRAFNAPGTPSAVLVDAHGRLASDVEIGMSGVLALAGAQSPHALALA